MFNRTGLKSALALMGILGLAVTAALAGPTPVGSLVGSTNAILDGQAALPNTTVLNGDNLQVSNGMAMVSLNRGNRMILGRGSEATFLKGSDGVAVSLARGSVALYHPQDGTGFRVKVGDITVAPEKGYRTLGEVAMADGLLVVTAKDGTLQVEKGGKTEEVSKGKTITIAAKTADAPAPAPQGNQHVKHILRISPAALLYLGIGAEIGGTTAAIVLGTRTPKQVSPVAP